MGIYAYNSGFHLDPLCSGTSQLGNIFNPCFTQVGADSNRFFGLNAGVRVINWNPAFVSSIRGAAFTDNLLGAEIFAGNNHEFYRNRVRIAAYQPTLTRGVVFNGATGFFMQENDISGTNGSNTSGPIQQGLQVNNSATQTQSDQNWVRNNSFDELIYAAVLSNDNDGPLEKDGLQYLCNTMENTSRDIFVHGKTGNSATDIALKQGYCSTNGALNFNSTPANNDFSSTCAGNTQLYVIKSSSQKVKYHYLDGQSPSCYTASKSELIGCGPFADGLGDQCTLSDKAAPSEMESSLQTLRSLKSGLPTPGGADLRIIQQTNLDVSDAQMKFVLDSASPWHGDSALVHVILNKPTPFDQDSLLAVLLENAPLEEVVMDALATAGLSGMAATIEAHVDTMSVKMSPRAKLEGHHEYLERLMDELEREIMRNWLIYDTTEYALDSALAWHDSLGGIGWAKERAYLLLRMHMADSAVAYANGLSNPSGELDDFLEWIDILHDIESDTLGAFKIALDSALEVRVRTLADTNNIFQEAYFARNMLHAVFNEPLYTPIYEMEDNGYGKRSEEIEFFDEFEETNSHLMVLYPNPTSGVITAEFTLPIGSNQAHIEVYSRDGRMVSFKVLPLKPETGKVELNLSSLGEGIYVCILNADSKVIARRKLMVAGR